jgi:hypothetical protein
MIEWVLVGGGIFCVGLSLLALWQIKRARSYIPVPGRIVERSVGPASWVKATGGWGSFSPQVKYLYWVNGSEFTSDRLALVPHRYGRRRAEAELANIPDELTVFVNPRDPSNAVIDRRGIGAAILTGVIGAIVLLNALTSILYR